MRLALISDLHLNHWPIDIKTEMESLSSRVGNVDVVINAGDDGEAHSNYDIQQYFPDVFYLNVMGNHDYYGGSFRNDMWFGDYEGIRFFGATLWTNFNDNTLSKLIAERAINDFRLIKGASVESMTAAFNDTVAAMVKYKPHVVITHFAPTHDAIDYERFGETPLNHFFCNNLASTIRKMDTLRLWVYGHTHSAKSFMIGNIPVVSNPLGYKGENYRNFFDYVPKLLNV